MNNAEYFKNSDNVKDQHSSNYLNYLPKLQNSKITGKNIISKSFKHSLLALNNNSLDILAEINENKNILTVKERKIFDNALIKLQNHNNENKVALPKVIPKGIYLNVFNKDKSEKVKKGNHINVTNDSIKLIPDNMKRSKLIDEYKVKFFDKEGYPKIDNSIKKNKVERIFDQTCQMKILIKEENDDDDPDHVYKDDILNVRDYLIRKDKLVNKTLKDMIPGCIMRRSIKLLNKKN